MKRQAPRASGFTLIELLIVVAIIGIIAAIAIPSLIRARVSANESATIGDIRTVISAEAAYHSASGGNYGVLTCLLRPNSVGCAAGTAPVAPTYLDSQIASLVTKSGYNRIFDASALVPGGRAGDLTCYVYQTVPASLGQTGVRGFAADCAGNICMTTDGSVQPFAGGLLTGPCLPLP